MELECKVGRSKNPYNHHPEAPSRQWGGEVLVEGLIVWWSEFSASQQYELRFGA